MVTIAGLPERWRKRAEELEAYAPPAATAFREAADTLERELESTLEEPLALDDASIESGYSVGHLRRLIREGKVPNAGTKGAPRILRKHLPVTVQKVTADVDPRRLRIAQRIAGQTVEIG